MKTSVDDRRAQLLGRSQRRAVEPSALPFSLAHRHLELQPDLAAAAGHRGACALCTEPHDLRVGAGPRREALRREVHGLEQVRLAHAVRADYEDEPGLQCQLEPLVGAKVAERGRLDDQPGRRIGMTR